MRNNFTGFALLMWVAFFACSQTNKKFSDNRNFDLKENEHIVAAIHLPKGYSRIHASDNGFASYLRSIILKKDKTVYLYNGIPKANQTAQYAVLDISVGNKDLQQCADAVMRLRAEYLYQQKIFSNIEFVTGEKKILNYAKWIQGKNETRKEFDKYLDYVFSYCGTASLPYSLKKKTMPQMQIGDVFLKPGSPGHAVMVMDMAENDKGQEIYLLVQSYMPAQNIHILKNPSNENLSPWYQLNDDTVIETPEWTFYNNQLYGWK
jgi:hypothetical protein